MSFQLETGWAGFVAAELSSEACHWLLMLRMQLRCFCCHCSINCLQSARLSLMGWARLLFLDELSCLKEDLDVYHY
jgi:hypothetical protein